MKYYKLEKCDGFYWPLSYNDEYLSMLVAIFTDGGSLDMVVKRELLNPEGRGATGNLTDVTIKGNTVIIQPAMFDVTDEPEEYAIEIDRDVLLDLINQWEDLKKKKAKEITFYRDEHNKITVEGAFDEEK